MRPTTTGGSPVCSDGRRFAGRVAVQVDHDDVPRGRRRPGPVTGGAAQGGEQGGKTNVADRHLTSGRRGRSITSCHDCRIVPSADAHPADATSDPRRELDVWAASGAMALTGRPGAPLGPPAGLVPKLEAVAGLLRIRSAALGEPVAVDAVSLLGERAAIAGLSPQGTVSCGGATRLLRAADGWFALTLAREDDVELVAPGSSGRIPASRPGRRSPRGRRHPAGRGARGAGGSSACRSPRWVTRRPCRPEPRAPAVAPHSGDTPRRGPGHEPHGRRGGGRPELAVGRAAVRVAARLRGRRGGEGGVHRAGPTAPAAAPGSSSTSSTGTSARLAVDFRSGEGRRTLREVLEHADVVIEGSRPRALEQLGIDAAALVAGGRPRVWVSITGYGRAGPERDRVAFGDDAAVAGGLVAWDGDEPRFCADAIADPCTGLVAAAGALDALSAGGRWLLDVPMASVAAHLAGPTLARSRRHRRPPLPGTGRSPAPDPCLGEHTAEVLDRSGRR